MAGESTARRSWTWRKRLIQAPGQSGRDMRPAAAPGCRGCVARRPAASRQTGPVPWGRRAWHDRRSHGPSVEADLRRDLFYCGSVPVPGQPARPRVYPDIPGPAPDPGRPSRADLSWSWSPAPGPGSAPGPGLQSGRAVDGLAEKVGVPVVARVLLHEVLPHPPHRGGLLPERDRVVQLQALQRGIDGLALGPVALEVLLGAGRVGL